MLSAMLVCGFGLSASAVGHSGGYFFSTTPTIAAEPVTRLVFSGPMPVWEKPAKETLAAIPSLAAVAFENRPAPTSRARNVSLPQIPHYELISEAKAATLNGRPILADLPVETGALPTRPFMTKMPTPVVSEPVGRTVFCDGSC